MSKVLYLLGAGASFGKRAEEPLEFEIDKITNECHVQGKDVCANILSGLPIVNEIPGRLSFLLQQLWNVYNIDRNKAKMSPIKRLIDDLDWLRNSVSNHATIDTLAKKLYLTKNEHDYQRLKNGLLVFLFYEQLIHSPDPRYDSFFASVLQENAYDLPKNISIISWNYDFQLEIAYNAYVRDGYLSRLSNHHLSSHDKLSEGIYNNPYIKEDGFNLLKLNGSAFISDKEFFFNCQKGEEVNTIIELYSSLSERNNRISFAWERIGKQFEKRIEDCVSEAEILVIIGYSFPFFNRQVDRLVFEKMYKLRKIYIQDPSAETVKLSLFPVLSNTQLNVSHLESKIITLPIDAKQFFFPPEL